MVVNNIANAVDAFIKKRKIIPSIFFKMLSSDLLDFHYKSYNKLLFNKYRILCSDGTHSQLSKNFVNNNYSLTKNNTYIDSLINKWHI